MTMDGSAKSWEMLPTETQQQFAAFEIYRQLNPYGSGETKRNIANVAVKLGLKATSNLEIWSSKNSWSERVRAYDSYVAASSITLQTKTAEEYAMHIVTKTTQRLAYAGQLVEMKMKKLREQMDAGVEVEASELKAVVASIKQIDDISRRSAGLATSYNSEVAPVDIAEDDDVFVVGAE